MCVCLCVGWRRWREKDRIYRLWCVRGREMNQGLGDMLHEIFVFLTCGIEYVDYRQVR